MTIKHRSQLGDLLRELGLPLIIAELGVAQGLFAKEIMDWGTEMLYLVDRWEYVDIHGDSGFSQEWHDDNLMQVKDRMEIYANRPGNKYKILHGNSVEMAAEVPDNTLSMVYLDADHSYEGVRNDLKAWYPKVVSGGLIAGHDYLNVADYGVFDAVKDFCSEKGYTPITIPENNHDDAGFYFIKH